jgi:ABC-type polysaccharide/polyol phosphate export permease
VFASIGWISLPENLLQVLLAWLLLTWFGFSLAILLGSLSEQYEFIEKLWHPIQYLLFPLSGAAFMVDALPPTAQKYLLYLPMVNGIEMLREGYFGSTIRAHYDLSYMIFSCLLLTLLGLAQTQIVSRKVIPE